MRTVVWSHPFREAAALAVPTVATYNFHCALAGHGYFLDLASDEHLWESLDFMRPQQDTGSETGEGSLSNIDLWTRSTRSWHLGAGQTRTNDRALEPSRFDSSKGVNVWEQWQLSLLNDTSVGIAGSGSPSSLAIAGGTIVYQAAAELKTSSDGVAWSPLTTIASAPTTRLVSDGENMFVGCADGKVKKVTPAGIVTDLATLASTNVLAISKGRIWAGALDVLWQFTQSAPTPVSAVDHPNPSWVWSSVCEGSKATYAGGNAGDKGEIWRIGIINTGTQLDVGTVAASLPDGENVYALASYLGYILIGTSKGVRFAVADSNGDLNYGSLIPTPGPVQAFEAQDRFVWFGWSDYDTTSTGLGRVDLSNFTSDLTPAYASDLMYLGQGVVTSIATYNDLRFFTVDGVGVIGEIAGVPTSTGSLVASKATFDLDNDKVATLFELTHQPLDGIVTISLAVDGSTSAVVAESSNVSSTGPINPFVLNAVRGHAFTITLTLVPGVSTGPVITGTVFYAHPVPPRGERFMLPIQLMEQIDGDGAYQSFDVDQELQFLRTLVRDGAPVTLQIANEAFNVFPANYKWVPYRQTQDKAGWTGTCTMELREVTQ